MTGFQDDSLDGVTLWGIFYPTDHIVAVFAQCADAEAAQAALAAAGYGETRFWTGQDVLQRGAAYRDQRTVLERLGAHLNGQAQGAAAQYVRAAELHQCFVTTHVPGHQQVAHAHALFAAHDAYIIRYYTASGTVDLHDERAPAQEPVPDEPRSTAGGDAQADPPSGYDPAW